jgi:hypothetical protein
VIVHDFSTSPVALFLHLSHSPRKELDEHLQTPILNSFWSRRFDLLQKDVDIQFITMLTDPDKISIAGTSRKRESQIILKTDERSIHLDLGREPKFNRLRRAGDPLQRHTAAARSN